MKNVIAATALVLAAGIAQAEPFAYELAVGDPDLHPTIEAADAFPSAERQIVPTDAVSSLDEIYRGSPDGDNTLETAQSGNQVSSQGLTGYDAFVQGNPDFFDHRS